MKLHFMNYNTYWWRNTLNPKEKMLMNIFFLLLDCSTSGCTTKKGPDPNKPCVFPFRYNFTIYNCCTFDGNGPGDTGKIFRL